LAVMSQRLMKEFREASQSKVCCVQCIDRALIGAATIV